MKNLKVIIKTHWLSLLCALAAIISLVIPVWPLGGYKKHLEEVLSSRASTYTALSQLRTKPRQLPIVDTSDPNAAAQSLDYFPTPAIIEKGNEAKTAFETQATQLIHQAIELNRHAPLVVGSLPTPPNALAFDFRDKFRDAIINGIPQMLRVGMPPTQDILKQAADDLWNNKYRPMLGGGGGTGGGQDRIKDALTAEYNQELATLPDIERQKVATSSLIYLNPDAFPTNPVLTNTGQLPLVNDIWYAQLELWIIQDVAHAILDIDGDVGAKNIIEAPVKHLVKINISPSPYIISAGQALDGDLTGPAPKVPDIVGFNMATGRVSNPLYDVVQFDLVVNVEVDSAPKFLAVLSRNRFITVIQTTVTAVDSSAAQQQGFIYGSKPVVQLNIKCESILFHKWERELMPDVVAKALTGQQPGANGGTDRVY